MLKRLGGLSLIYEASPILADAVFEMALSVGLVKSLQRIDRPNWIGNVFLNTWKPFAVTVCLALLVGVLAQSRIRMHRFQIHPDRLRANWYRTSHTAPSRWL